MEQDRASQIVSIAEAKPVWAVTNTMPTATTKPITGTGGVPDVVTYLGNRLNLHKRVGTLFQARQSTHRAAQILRCLDQKNLDEFLSFFSVAAVFRFGSQPPVHGIQAIADGVRRFLDQMACIAHTIAYERPFDDTLVIQGDVRYLDVRGRDVTIPFCDVWRFGPSGKIREYLIYCDPSPLYLVEA